MKASRLEEIKGGIDAHVHSKIHSGELAPREIVRMAKESGLAAVSITDHDSVDGVKEALDEGLRQGVIVIPGVEISASEPSLEGNELHVLGYGVSPGNPELKRALHAIHAQRRERTKKKIDALRKSGITVTKEQEREALNARVPALNNIIDSVRANPANEGLFPKGEKPEEWLYGKVLPKKWNGLIPFKEAIRLITVSGGVPVLAHPPLQRSDEEVERLLALNKREALGLQGIEVMHSKLTAEQTESLLRMARKYGLRVLTTGSDYHTSKRQRIGLPADTGEAMKTMLGHPRINRWLRTETIEATK